MEEGVDMATTWTDEELSETIKARYQQGADGALVILAALMTELLAEKRWPEVAALYRAGNALRDTIINERE